MSDSDGGESAAGTYRCDIHDFETESRGQMQQHIDKHHPGGAAKDRTDEFLVEDDAAATVRIDSAKVSWADDEVATAIDIPVEILPNGWIYTPETNCYYPPSEVVEVERYTEADNDRAEAGG